MRSRRCPRVECSLKPRRCVLPAGLGAACQVSALQKLPQIVTCTCHFSLASRAVLPAQILRSFLQHVLLFKASLADISAFAVGCRRADQYTPCGGADPWRASRCGMAGRQRSHRCHPDKLVPRAGKHLWSLDWHQSSLTVSASRQHSCHMAGKQLAPGVAANHFMCWSFFADHGTAASASRMHPRTNRKAYIFSS